AMEKHSLQSCCDAQIPFFAVIDFEANTLVHALDVSSLKKENNSRSGSIRLNGQNLHFRFANPQPLRQRFALQRVNPPDKAHTLLTIQQLQKHLHEGYSYLVNYCTQTGVKLPLSPMELFLQSTAPFTIYYENEFVAFSPEAFVSVEGDTICATPMKGTGYIKEELLASTKEQAEHATVVDLLRNDLARVAKEVRIENYRYITEIPQADGRTLYQTSTAICGTMPPDWRRSIPIWLPHLLPAGSVTGAPKRETVSLIRRYETEPRGFYTGIAALFDGENFYSCVLIRYIDLRTQPYQFRSGVGITIYSDAEAEYEEILQKVYIPL
ncbi:MAG TPA: aminodeoxychorismate synthase component I, partial [Turneriella sp.]|nr:aminodeoxychorismate synthase component I [Turneriella sp.]